jgi:predicted ATPase
MIVMEVGSARTILMYVTRAQIRNIRSIYELDWQIKPEEAPGWHVILGENGSGKSTLLRAIALGLVGAEYLGALRQDWNEWLTHDEDSGRVDLTLRHDPDYDPARKATSKRRNAEFMPSFFLQRVDSAYVRPQSPPKWDSEKSGADEVWMSKEGWFSASYGPFRRFSGSTTETQRFFERSSSNRLAAHLSIFGEEYALTEALEWLRQLQFQRLEKRVEGNLLDKLKKFVNQPDFLPHNARLDEISSEGLTFKDANDNRVPVGLLSDGYRSILSMMFELIRQMSLAYRDVEIFSEDATQIIAPGVVLIDEPDAHLHPTWQRRIGFWLREHFPNVQFIVSTHSPLICQAAIQGSIWKLPRPGSEQEFHRVQEPELNRLLYGNILDAFGTELFGSDVARSEPAKEMLERLAELNMKELTGGLSSRESAEQQDLRATMPTAASASKQRK